MMFSLQARMNSTKSRCTRVQHFINRGGYLFECCQITRKNLRRVELPGLGPLFPNI